MKLRCQYFSLRRSTVRNLHGELLELLTMVALVFLTLWQTSIN